MNKIFQSITILLIFISHLSLPMENKENLSSIPSLKAFCISRIANSNIPVSSLPDDLNEKIKKYRQCTAEICSLVCNLKLSMRDCKARKELNDQKIELIKESEKYTSTEPSLVWSYQNANNITCTHPSNYILYSIKTKNPITEGVNFSLNADEHYKNKLLYKSDNQFHQIDIGPLLGIAKSIDALKNCYYSYRLLYFRSLLTCVVGKKWKQQYKTALGNSFFADTQNPYYQEYFDTILKPKLNDENKEFFESILASKNKSFLSPQQPLQNNNMVRVLTSKKTKRRKYN